MYVASKQVNTRGIGLEVKIDCPGGSATEGARAVSCYNI